MNPKNLILRSDQKMSRYEKRQELIKYFMATGRSREVAKKLAKAATKGY